MIDIDNLSAAQLASGTAPDGDGGYVCAECGKSFARGEIFKVGDRYFDAERAAELHVASEHKDRFGKLLRSEQQYLNLTENQRELLTLFRAGMPDGEIAKRLGVAASTVRHQRFVLRERAKAAKLYCAIWELVGDGKSRGAELLPVHEGAKMVDERYEITEDENEKILKNVFSSLDPLRLKVFSSKEKKKVVTLRKIAEQFERGKKYTEAEVNDILSAIYEDFATLRRYLIEYGYLERTRDCSSYWVK